MRRVLVYENRKRPAAYWDASTPELEAGAFLALFKELDDIWQVYAALKEDPYVPARPESHPEGCMCSDCVAHRKAVGSFDRAKIENARQLVLYKRAKEGDASAARTLLKARRAYEYEAWKIASVTEEAAKYPDEEVYGTPRKPCNSAIVTDTGLIKYYLHGKVSYRLHMSEDVAHAGIVERGRWKKVSSRKARPSDSFEIIKAVLPDHDISKGVAAKYPVGTVVSPKRITEYVMVACPTHERERDRFKKGLED